MDINKSEYLVTDKWVHIHYDFNYGEVYSISLLSRNVRLDKELGLYTL